MQRALRGPDDNGLVVDGPGRLAKKAFEDGALRVSSSSCMTRRSRIDRTLRDEVERDPSSFGQAVMAVVNRTPVLAMVTSLRSTQYCKPSLKGSTSRISSSSFL